MQHHINHGYLWGVAEHNISGTLIRTKVVHRRLRALDLGVLLLPWCLSQQTDHSIRDRLDIELADQSTPLARKRVPARSEICGT